MSEGRFDIRIPFVDHLGVELLEKADGRVRIAFAPRPEHFNSWNGIHGGVVMTLLDVTMGAAARSVVPHSAGVVTVDMSVSFLSAGQGRLTVDARVLRSGASIVFCEGEMRDEAGELVAKAMASFKVKRKVSPGETAN